MSVECMSLYETVKCHRRLWGWIADQCIKQKRVVKNYAYFLTEDGSLNRDNLIFDMADVPRCHCYACNYSINEAIRTEFQKSACEMCPFDWVTDENDRQSCINDITRKGLVAQYNDLEPTAYVNASKIAKRIADLGLKPEVLEEYEKQKTANARPDRKAQATVDMASEQM